MYTLALDTSMAACSAALSTSDGMTLKASRFAAMPKGQAEALAPMVQDLMSDARADFSELSQILVTCGPGTFTGLRIGLSFAKGLKLACAVPLFAIDSLRAIAYNEQAGDLPLMVVCMAGTHDFYIATYSRLNVPDLAPCLMSRAEVLSHLNRGPFRLIGNGADHLRELGELPWIVRSLSGDVPNAKNFIRSIQDKAHLREANPLYLRPPDIKKPAGQDQADQKAIVPVGREASPLLAALHERCFAVPWREIDFIKLLESPNCRARLICQGVEPVGFSLSRQAADEAEILTIGVLAPHRQSGLASSLLQSVLEEMRASGVTAVFLEVASDNQAALSLYKRVGFEPAGLRRGYYQTSNGTAQDALVLRKNLTHKGLP